MISVCMATYNGEKFIRQQLSSILEQIDRNDEIIISDDGSTDSTLAVITSFNDNRIKVFNNAEKVRNEQYKFQNVTENFENCIKRAKGDYIYLADQDDKWSDEKVQVCQKALETYTLVISDCSIIDENNKTLIVSYFQWNNSKPGIFKNVFFKNSYLGCCMAFRKELIKKILPMSSFIIPHDVWIGTLAEYYGKVLFLNKSLVYYRRHGGNASPSGNKSTNKLFFKVRYRALLLTSLFKRIYNWK
jgi:glycosyltransferase involved in cell wall biosynthesis